ncbi:MAG: AI-2E family transporter [Motilibacteraceae bacterium]
MSATSLRVGDRRERVPVRTILATIGLVLLTYIALRLVQTVSRVLIWTLIAAFFAVALHPLVDRLERHVGGRRWLATLVVFLGVLLALSGLVTLFVTPFVQQGDQLASSANGVVDQVKTGQGPIGDLLHRFNVDQYVSQNQAKIRDALSGLGTPALHALQTAATGVAAAVTIFVLAYLMVLEGPRIIDGALNLLPQDRARRVRRVSGDCARTVTGYLSGNLLISVICGVLTFVVLRVAGVPFAGLIALFVAVADLIPLIGATMGAVVAVVAAFIHSVPAGIAAVVFFLVYQQLENHLLQPVILSRTVKLNPLAVLFSILVGVELAGILGALLAIPVAGIVQVIVRDVYDGRRGQLKDEPTVGEDEEPADLTDHAGDGARTGS